MCAERDYHPCEVSFCAQVIGITSPTVPNPAASDRRPQGAYHPVNFTAKLGIPSAPMKAHALRSTFISMALEDGTDDRLIERITHTPGKGRRAFDRYDRADYWPQLCAEVAKLCISPRSGGHVVELATALATGGGIYGGSAMMMVETPGVERGRLVRVGTRECVVVRGYGPARAPSRSVDATHCAMP
jgi:hypothetical protein